jgi:hypothetical protein
MSQLGILQEFDALPRPAGDGERFAVRPIGQHACQIGKSTAGEPALLIGVLVAPPRDRPAPIVLEHVRVLHDVDCRVSGPGGTEQTERFTVVLCTDSDRPMQEYFLLTVSAVVLTLGSVPSRQDVVDAISTLTDLFRSMTQAPRRSIQGLWAELFVLAQAPDLVTLIPCWHSLPESRYDFSAGVQRVEVKSAAGRVRSHHFSLDQLRPPVGTRVLVASVFVEGASGGTSSMELFEEVRAQAAGDTTLLLHLDRVLRLSLGSAWRQGVEERFDRQLAATSLRFFETQTIPAIDAPVPPEVSDIHFRVDLSNLQPADLSAVADEGGMFRTIVRPPRRHGTG